MIRQKLSHCGSTNQSLVHRRWLQMMSAAQDGSTHNLNIFIIFMSDTKATPYNTGYSGEIGQITNFTSTFCSICGEGELQLVFFKAWAHFLNLFGIV